ncbi:MAG: hypothetical protein J4G05_04360 [Chlorobi bacterium]|nr:hypothetical protein [Chlorobiota bacterium]
MANRSRQNDDILWKMLNAELGVEEIHEVQEYLRGKSPFFDMGYGALTIEPYDGHEGRNRIYRVRHEEFGEEQISRAALQSLLHDLLHYRRKQKRLMPTHLN